MNSYGSPSVGLGLFDFKKKSTPSSSYLSVSQNVNKMYSKIPPTKKHWALEGDRALFRQNHVENPMQKSGDRVSPLGSRGTSRSKGGVHDLQILRRIFHWNCPRIRPVAFRWREKYTKNNKKA